MKYNTKDITCVISTNRICSLSDIYEKRLSNDGDINKLVDRLKNQDYELIKKRAIEICNSFLKNNKLLELNNDILQSHLFSCLRDNSFNRKENIDLEYDLYNYKPRNIPVYDKINELDLKVITTIISQYDSLNELLKKDDVNSNIIFYIKIKYEDKIIVYPFSSIGLCDLIQEILNRNIYLKEIKDNYTLSDYFLFKDFFGKEGDKFRTYISSEFKRMLSELGIEVYDYKSKIGDLEVLGIDSVVDSNSTSPTCISKKDLSILSNDFMNILHCHEKTFESLQYLYMVGLSSNNFIKGIKNVYCKHCRRNTYIPSLLFSSSDVRYTYITCPMCGQVHCIDKHKSYSPYKQYSNTEMFDDIDTQGKIRIKSRIIGYEEKQFDIYPINIIEFLVYDLIKNRAYFVSNYNDTNGVYSFKKKVMDIEGVDLYKSILFKADYCYFFKNNMELVHINNKMETIFDNLYYLIKDNINFTYSKEELLLAAKKMINREMYFKTIDIKKETIIAYKAMQVIGCFVKNNNLTLNELIQSNNRKSYITRYIDKQNKKDGMYLKRKYNMSNQIRKQIIKDPCKIINYLLFKDVVNDNNNLNKLINIKMYNKDVEKLIEDFSTNVSFGNEIGFYEEVPTVKYIFKNLGYFESVSKSISKGMENLKKLYKDETTFVNRFISNDMNDISSYLNDVCDMLDIISKRNIKSTGIKLNFNSKFKLKRLHDELTSVINKLGRENVQINHIDLEKNLEYNNDTYKILLAKDTHQLIDIGSKMNICVGSYYEKSLSKRCTIMYVLNNDKDYVCCIELTPYTKSSDGITLKYKLKQAKCYSNRFPSGELKRFILNWANKNNAIEIDTYDLEESDLEESGIGDDLNFIDEFFLAL